MTAMQPLLIELGTDELPIKALPGLAQALFDNIIDGLDKRGIGFARGEAKPLYTPRRLAVLLPGVAVDQSQQPIEMLGPYLNIALDAEGRPTAALQGFAGKAGVAWTQLERVTDHKGERFVYRAVRAGARTAELLPLILREAIATMPLPRPMRWGNHEHAFARPVHWLVLLHGKDVVDAELFGIRADRMSHGHRFMHDKTVWIARPDDYIGALHGAKVLVDPAERRERIVRAVELVAQAAGGSARIDEDNLAQVNCLVEWPSAVACSFDPEFLAVPAEALIATMQTHQKFFPVLSPEGRLTEHFVGVANIESQDVAKVRQGYERVIRPRFSDAQFFFVEDKKQGLAAMSAGLAHVTYHAKLGSIQDKLARVAALAEAIAPSMGVEPAMARRASLLSKADLQSRLVNEFPELQGIAGRYYAMHDTLLADLGQEDRNALANAIDEAYRPRYAGDDIALSPLGKTLAIAERLDTLAGGFAAGLKPTGNKDPFALRRNALGLARTIIESGIEITLWPLLDKANDLATQALMRVGTDAKSRATGKARTSAVSTSLPAAQGSAESGVENVRVLYDFILERLRGYYTDKGVLVPHFNAVAQLRPASLYDFDRRIDAIGTFATTPEAAALAAANKRINNILRKAGLKHAAGDIPAMVNPALLTEPAESALAESIEAVYAETNHALAHHDYVDALAHLARLRPQVDAFFDNVMVNVEDVAVRDNRLALLQRLSARLGSVAAIEHLSGAHGSSEHLSD